jgi:Ser/Thr protein kinase RdoA (MazF antagonist)
VSELAQVLGAWGLSAHSVTAVEGGSQNRNFDVRTSSERFFLRLVRPNLENERILGEHELMRWVAGRGVPAPVPVLLPSGLSVLQQGAERWVLFPWAEGEPGVRGSLTAGASQALGAAHGLVQAVLREHPASAGAAFGQHWDGDTSRRDLASLIALGREGGAPGVAIAAMERQLALLERADLLPPAAFAGLPSQMLHGDFHDRQVLFAGNRVTAVVDWEAWRVDSRAWELVRSLAFSRLLDSPSLEAYVAGYRRFVAVTPDEIELALTLWFQSRLTGLWLWHAYLVEGNQRLAEFFAESARQLELQADDAWVRDLRRRLVAAACG